MAATAEQALAGAQRWIGTVEQPSGSNKVPGVTDWYGLTGPWCAMWVSRVMSDVGFPEIRFAYTPTGAAMAKRKGQWVDAKDLRAGDLCFFHWPDLGRIAHVGIVEGRGPDGALHTIEGNTDVAGGRTGGQVMRKVRRANVVGGWRPPYAQQVEAGPPPKRAYPGHLIQRGAKGDLVRWVQERLNAHIGAGLRLDGDFGPKTLAAVKAFQRHAHLGQDGIVGPKTWAALA